jgi:hypothetical protein
MGARRLLLLVSEIAAEAGLPFLASRLLSRLVSLLMGNFSD